jgi:outer membrane protein assembly factor BamB
MLLALVAVLASPAAQPLAEPRLELLYRLARGGETLAFGQESLYELVATPTGRAVTAYRLADGGHRWTVPVPVAGDSPWVEVAGDVPVVTGRDPDSGDPTALVVHALDPRTGRVRWSRPGSPMLPAAGSGGQWLAVHHPLPGEDGSLSPSPAQISAVHIATGRTLWSFRTGLGVQTLFDRDWPWTGGEPARYVTTLAPDGLLARHHLATGAEVARVGTAAVRPYHNYLQLAGGMIFLWHGPDTVRRLAVYDATTLEHRWTVGDLGTGGSVTDCGPVVCLGRDGPDPRLDGIEAATGRVRWSRPCGEGGEAALFCYLDVRPLPAAGRLAVQMQPLGPGGVAASSVLLDPGTGAPVLDLYGWFPLWPMTGPDPVFYRQEPTSPRLDGPPDVIRLGRLSAGPAGIRTLGTVRAEWCDVSGGYAICATGSLLVEVWRIR